MLPYTRMLRVGWLGLVGTGLLTSAGSAGPVGLLFYGTDDPASMTSIRRDATPVDSTIRTAARQEANSSRTEWFAFEVRQGGSRDQPSTAVVGGSNPPQQALAVPIEPISLSALLAMTGGMLMIGKRLTGIRR